MCAYVTCKKETLYILCEWCIIIDGGAGVGDRALTV